MKIGPYQLSSIETGEIWLDGGAMFGTVPRVLWEKSHPPDAKNRIRLAMRALLIEGSGKKILVDCGVGDKGGEKFRELYNVDHSGKSLEKSLMKRGLAEGDITDVILTHLHFDHAGGATTRMTDGTYRPTFPNATYYLQKRNLDVAMTPNPRERASYLKENFQALLDHDCLRLLDGPGPLFPGIEIVVSFGHTEAQQHAKVSDGKTTVFYGGDILPCREHIPVPWVPAYDLQPLVVMAEKEKILSQAADQDWLIFYEHDPRAEASHVRRGPKGYLAGDPVTL